MAGVLIFLGFMGLLGCFIFRDLTRKREAAPPAGSGSALGGCLGCIGLITVAGIGLLILAVVFVGSTAHEVGERDHPAIGTQAPTAGLLSEVAAFLETHREFGAPTRTQYVPDWAKGKRQRVGFDSGRSLLFYTKNGVVVTVYEDDPSEGRVKIWGEYETTSPP
jgi:hypothetical protein